jgi:heme/copper-type cytochrome/quinol oxidase subunit 2
VKKSLGFGLLVIVSAVLLVLGAACGSGVSQEEVDELSASLEAANSKIAALAKSLEPKTHNLSIRIAEGGVIGPDNAISGVYYRWEPQVLVVSKGDKVILEVENTTQNVHSFRLEALEVNTDQVAPGAKATVEFTAGQTGVFQYRCGVRFDAAQNWCARDHGRQVGQLIVLEQ